MFFLPCCGFTGAFAQDCLGPDWAFCQNKGQLEDSNIAYYGHQGGVNVYCKPGRINFVFIKKEYSTKISEATGQLSEPLLNKRLNDKKTILNGNETVSMHKAELQLLNANLKAEITAKGRQEYFENYYTTGDANHGITNVHTFKTITYKNIYNHIDLVLLAKPNGLKYEFRIKAGGNINDIQIQWNGLGNIKQLKGGGISYRFTKDLNGFESDSLGFTESAPYSYQDHSTINSKFIIQSGTGLGTKLTFSVGAYDKTKTLVIDPDLIWGMDYGGSGDNAAQGITTDASHNVYITGYTSSTGGIATTGAYQTTMAGLTDAFVAKFTPSGKLAWATYYGGNGDDFGYSIAADVKNHIVISGLTESTTGIATNDAYQANLAGGDNADAFVAKFDSSGILLWGTYFGGSNGDCARGITTDTNNNIFITGETTSATGIATNGAQLTSLAGNEDAFVAKFTPAGALAWGTYYGGSKNDWALGITHDISNNIYITGFTMSKNGIATAGAYQTSYAGGEDFGDAFVAKFDPSGILLWGTYYGGSGDEEGYGIAADSEKNIYITGYTGSTSGIATKGAYQSSFAGGNSDVFIAKFSTSGSLSWATYYGGSLDDIGEGIATGPDNSVYITGYTNSTNGIATKGAYSTKPANVFLAKFTPSGNLYWGTYYRSGYGDGIIAGDNNNIYITGTYQSGFAASGDAFLAKFHTYNYDAALTAIVSPAAIICQGESVIKVLLKNLGNNLLAYDSIYWEINGKLQKGIKWTGSLNPDSGASVTLGTYNFLAGIDIEPGFDTIIAWSAKPNGATDSLSGNDTTKVIITAEPLPAAFAGNSKAICKSASYDIGMYTYPGTRYFWASNPAGFSSSLSNPKVTPAFTTTYYLTDTIAASGCANSASVVIMVDDTPVNIAGNNQAICKGKSASIGAAIVARLIYSWASKPAGYSDTSANPSVSPSIATTYYINATNSCGSKSDSVVIKVNPVPLAMAGQNHAICFGGNTSIGAAPVSGDTYSWIIYPETGIDIKKANPAVSPASTTTYYLLQTNPYGCTSEDSVVITVNGLPLVLAGQNFTVQDSMSTFMLNNFSPPGGKWRGRGVSPEGNFTPAAAGLGEDTLTYTCTNTSGCTDSASIIVKVKPQVKGVDAGIEGIISPNGRLQSENYPVIVNLKSFGETQLYFTSIHWEVNNVNEPVYNWQGRIGKDSSAAIILSSHFNFKDTGIYIIKAWTVNPDSSIDINHNNDTSERIFSIFTTSVEQLPADMNNAKIWYSAEDKKAHIQVVSDNDRQAIARLADGQGKVLSRLNLSMQPGFNQSQIDMSCYPPGVYLIFIQGNTISITGKIIKE